MSYLLQARVFLALGEIGKAENALDAAAKLNSQSPWLPFYIANLMSYENGDPQVIKELYQHAFNLADNDRNALLASYLKLINLVEDRRSGEGFQLSKRLQNTITKFDGIPNVQGLIENKTEPFLVLFSEESGAGGCGPCQLLNKEIDNIEKHYKGKLTVYRVIWEKWTEQAHFHHKNAALYYAYDLKALPALLVYTQSKRPYAKIGKELKSLYTEKDIESLRRYARQLKYGMRQRGFSKESATKLKTLLSDCIQRGVCYD